MAFIKIQNIRYDEKRNIVSGTASIVDTIYDPHVSGHSRHKVRENLGKIWALSADRKSGIFQSPVRGLVSYNVTDDMFELLDAADPRVRSLPKLAAPPVHADFGSTYLFVSFLKNRGWLDPLQAIFSKGGDYERLLAHVTHSFLRDGSRIKCDTFIGQSALSNVLTSVVLPTLRSDTRYFELMGEDASRMRFFRSCVEKMREENPEFGRACYVDSTPLPDDITHSPYNALRCERGRGCSVQMRLALVLDEATGMPVWYEVIPGNLLDVSTLNWITRDVKASLGIEICSVVLDAGYVSEELIHEYGGSDSKTMIARMPNRKGYPYKTLYHKVKDQIDRGKYDFMRAGHVYFGRPKREELFGESLFAYIYVDKDRALREYRHWRRDHEDEFEALKDRDKRWRTVSSGYFVLLSNIEDTTAGMLDRYLKRVDVELVFKDAKSFEGLLPLAKWTDQRVRGKILTDVIDTMLRVDMLKALGDQTDTLMDLFHDAASVGCFRENDRLRIEAPNKQARSAFKTFQTPCPLSVDIVKWAKDLGL